MTTPVTYEVSVWVPADIADDYAVWLRDHVRRMLQLPGFEDARIQDVVEPVNEDGTLSFCVRYRLSSRQHLDDYFAGAAAAMRAEGVARFGERVRYARRILIDSAY